MSRILLLLVAGIALTGCVHRRDWGRLESAGPATDADFARDEETCSREKWRMRTWGEQVEAEASRTGSQERVNEIELHYEQCMLTHGWGRISHDPPVQEKEVAPHPLGPAVAPPDP